MKIDDSIPPPLFAFIVSGWHWWFAWRPVRTWDGRRIWLKKTWRRLAQKRNCLDGVAWQTWQYHYPCGYVDPENNGDPK